MTLLLLLLTLAAMDAAERNRGCRPIPAALDYEVPFACAIPGLQLTSWSRAANVTNCDSLQLKAEFQDQPEVRYPNATSDAYYTLVMVDPDAPGMMRGEYWLHWIVSNIKGSDFQIGNLDDASEIASYVGPAPPEGSGAHRYILLALPQAPAASPVAPPPPSQRPRFRLASWLRATRALCAPQAAAQFRAQF